MPSFSAALLAGGQSTRMGRDKALLPLPGSDLLLWQGQLRTLEELHPDEIFWSGPSRPGLPGHVRPVSDAVENAGPLAGISACLNFVRSDLLVALAIDMPRMNSAFLKHLLARCSLSCGAVVQHGDFFEPLAAIYPKSLHVLAAEHLRQKRSAMQDFVREAIQHGLLRACPLGKSDNPLFENLNSPSDFQGLQEKIQDVNDESLFIVMGVSGSGKTTKAQMLAQATGGDWLDADDFHSAENKAKMTAGIPLTDDDRVPWLDRLNAELRAAASKGRPVFLACSALKQKYRDRLIAGLLQARFIYLKGSLELIRSRLSHRKGHFMPAGLLESQFSDLEEPKDAIVLDISRTDDQLLEDFRRMANNSC